MFNPSRDQARLFFFDIWHAQRHNTQPDNEVYLECLRRRQSGTAATQTAA